MATLREQHDELVRLVRVLGEELRKASRIDDLAAAVNRWLDRWSR